jgi:hypothetical protein
MTCRAYPQNSFPAVWSVEFSLSIPTVAAPSHQSAQPDEEIRSGNFAESCKGKKPVGRPVEGIDFGP